MYSAHDIRDETRDKRVASELTTRIWKTRLEERKIKIELPARRLLPTALEQYIRSPAYRQKMRTHT